MKKHKHNYTLIPRKKMRDGGPMNVFIRCKNKSCIAGIDWMALDDPKKLLQEHIERTKNDRSCPYTIRDF